jgi:hypothetical protein
MVDIMRFLDKGEREHGGNIADPSFDADESLILLINNSQGAVEERLAQFGHQEPNEGLTLLVRPVTFAGCDRANDIELVKRSHRREPETRVLRRDP